MKKSKEEQIRLLVSTHSFPPLEVVIPILENAGRGEKELANQIHDTDVFLANGLKEILGLKDKNMRAVAKIFGVLLGSHGQRFEPVELSESRFSLTVSDCPMMHVGKNVSASVRSKYCDLVCSAGSKAIAETILGPESACSWDKALIKGAGKCKVEFALGRKNESH
jgi:hypothetical protein